MYYSFNNSIWGKRVEKLIDIIFPMSTYCIVCGNYVDDTRKYSLCDNCIEKMRFGFYYIDLDKEASDFGRDKTLDLSLTCMKYGLYEKEIGTSLKYKGNTYISRIIAEIMCDRIMKDEIYGTDILSSDLIIPIPITEKRKAERGFNQTEKIGKYLSQKIGIKMEVDALKRVKETSPQKELSKEERLLNILDAFSVNSDLIKGRDIVLIDDFYTTGVTCYEASKCLKENGARNVYALTLSSKSNYIREESFN